MDYPMLTAMGTPDKRCTAVADMTGAVFGRLTVIRRAPVQTYGRSHGAKWVCKCTCGQEVEATGVNLRRGNTRSCGCLRTEVARQKLEKIRADRLEEKYIRQEREAIQEECNA